MQNINNEIRNKIFALVEDFKEKTPYHEDTCIAKAANYYYEQMQKTDNFVLKNLFGSVLYLDFYRCLAYQKKNNKKIDFSEANILNITNDLNSDEIVNMLLNNYEFLLSAISYSYNLKNLSVFEKIIVYGSLTDDENEKLNNKFENSKYDLETYNPKIDIDFVTKKINDLYDAEIDISEANQVLVRFMEWLKVNRESIYDDLLKEFIESDSKFNVEIIENDYNISELEDIMPKMTILKLLCLEKDKLFSEYKNNPNYVRKAISSFLIVSTKYIENTKKKEVQDEKTIN